jgi:hypothetical protein
MRIHRVLHAAALIQGTTHRLLFSDAFACIDAYSNHHRCHCGAKEGMSDNPGEAA